MSEAEDFLKIGTEEWSASKWPASFSSEVRLKKKLLLIAASWIAGLLIACPDPRAIMYLPFFPWGLALIFCALFNPKHPNESLLFYGGWLIYVTLVVTALIVPRKKWFYVVWIIMTLFLVLNGVSCHYALKGMNNIH